jgi:phage-related holin
MDKNIDVGVTSFMAIIAGVFAFLGLSAVQFLILIILMSLDMITGIAKSYRIDKKSITSNAMKIGLFSKLFYIIVPIVLALAAKGINLEGYGLWFASFAVTILILAEAYSILGNIYSFKTGKEAAEVDGVSYLLLFIRKLIIKLIDGKVEK